MNQNSIAEQLRVAALQWQDVLEQGFREEGKVAPRITEVIYSIQRATVTMESLSVQANSVMQRSMATCCKKRNHLKNPQST